MKVSRDNTDKWQFAIDRGGTFTDVIGIDSDGDVHVHKLLSESPAYPDATIEGIRRIFRGRSHGKELSTDNITGIRLGTTIATNALLERRGAPTALIITAGFEDLLEIGDQSRPDIFSLAIKKPKILYQEVFGVRERINARGEIEHPLNEKQVSDGLARIRQKGFNSVAIVLMHAWKNPAHEKIVEKIALQTGFNNVSVSHKIMPLIKIVGRGQTSMVDAYLSPVLHDSIRNIQEELSGLRIDFMKSSGGLVPAGLLRAKDTILSGPAGGVIGFAEIAKSLRIEESIGFDMGGTSTDVARFGGEFERVFETTTGGVQYKTDQLDVETVAAGGGSILWFDGQKFNVGPESAGADPGPACYGRGGQLTVTDANLLLGRIIPDFMPKTFGLQQNQTLDTKTVIRKFRELTENINQQLGLTFSPYTVAEGFVRVANEIMGRAIKKISIARGYDLRKHTLICYGGAAPQHACAIARTLGIREIIIPPLAGVLSAYGIAIAGRVERVAKAVMKVFSPREYQHLRGVIKSLNKEIVARMGPDVAPEEIVFKAFLDLRPLGSDTYLSVPMRHYPEKSSYQEALNQFRQRYRQRFGYYLEKEEIEVVNVRLEGSVTGQLVVEFPRPLSERPARNDATGTREVYFDGKPIRTPVIRRKDIQSGDRISGPAIIADDHYTVVLEPDFRAAINVHGHIVIQSAVPADQAVAQDKDPVMLEVFNHLFMSIAEQMGYTLRNTAHSVNMKERLDFSCAIFNAQGDLVANAPHIPVHLGAMSESVKYIKQQNEGKMNPGDMYLTNDPHCGGSHLPDLTVIAPVFSEGEALFFVAARGHHADIGGITPGSMPPLGTKLEEEGVVIDNFLLVSNNRFREKEIAGFLTETPYPARNIPERLSDLRAQVAANQKGIRELHHLVKTYSLPVVTAYMKYIQDNAAQAMTEALGQFLKDRAVFEGQFEDYMDEGLKIAVKIRIEKGESPPLSHRMLIDFSGTSPEVKGNLNAPVSVTKAAVLYVLRTLIERDIPLNSGCMKPVDIYIPAGSLLNPSSAAAVVGGNVETSQRVVDVLLGALGKAAASQGTMNNFLFGQEGGSGKQYYETIAGGSGAVEGAHGAAAVQVHMTNTRITDPEVLEHRFPELTVARFGIRRGTGGKGQWNGGDGVERALRFSKPVHVSILSERRKYRPYGLRGGQPGASGQNILIKSDGSKINLEGKVDRIVQAGETVVIRTPGGGGFGKSG